MKDGIKIALVYIGLVIGAGFASGREILEYFVIEGYEGVIPVFLAFVLFSAISYIILCKSKKYQIGDFGEFIDFIAGRAANIIKLVIYTFMFCGFFVMLSAGGELFKTGFNLNYKYGIILLSVICFIVFSFDVKGIITINSILVPLMIAGISYLSITSILYESVSVSALDTRGNPLLSAICYVSYNTITAGAVLVPLYSIVNKKSIKIGVFLGSGIMCLLIFIIRAVLTAYYDKILYSEMPMLDLAVMRGEIYRIVYTLVLFMSVCTTAVSHGFGVLSRIPVKNGKERMIVSGIFCLAALPFSDLNFSYLVSTLYSFFGYIGLFWLMILIFRK